MKLELVISVREGSIEALVPSPTANQTAPRRHYVYGHRDEKGKLFYVGEGVGRRAWSRDGRHTLWRHYVDKHLGGHFAVVILVDDLSKEEAEALEGRWIGAGGEHLVNWINVGRPMDLAAMERLHRLRNANRELAASARSLEQTDVEQAIGLYGSALAAIHEYASIRSNGGLVGALEAELEAERGCRGDVDILDRLTLCLKRAGRTIEAATVAREYFDRYRADRKLAKGAAIARRVGIS